MSNELTSLTSEGGQKNNPAGTQTGKSGSHTVAKILDPCTVEQAMEQTNHACTGGRKNREQNANIGMQ